MSSERQARVWFTSWAGFNFAEVVVVGETPKRYRVRFTSSEGIVKGRQYLLYGEHLVPKHSVSFCRACPRECSVCDPKGHCPDHCKKNAPGFVDEEPVADDGFVPSFHIRSR